MDVSSNTGILQKMKEGAENVEKKLQAKVESMKNANEGKGEFFFNWLGHCLNKLWAVFD